MAIVLFNTLDDKQKQQAIQNLITNSSPRQDFFFMVALSVLMATFGLLLNNVAVIIGSMLIAPLLYPLLSLALGIVILDYKLVFRSLYTTLKSIIIGVLLAAAVTFLFSVNSSDLTTEILDRATTVSAYIFLSTIIAGLAGSYAFVKPQLNERLPGVAISVALIPPIAVLGIGLALLDWFIIVQSFILLFVNVFGVIFCKHNYILYDAP